MWFAEKEIYAFSKDPSQETNENIKQDVTSSAPSPGQVLKVSALCPDGSTGMRCLAPREAPTLGAAAAPKGTGQR